MAKVRKVEIDLDLDNNDALQSFGVRPLSRIHSQTEHISASLLAHLAGDFGVTVSNREKASSSRNRPTCRCRPSDGQKQYMYQLVTQDSTCHLHFDDTFTAEDNKPETFRSENAEPSLFPGSNTTTAVSLSPDAVTVVDANERNSLEMPATIEFVNDTLEMLETLCQSDWKSYVEIVSKFDEPDSSEEYNLETAEAFNTCFSRSGKQSDIADNEDDPFGDQLRDFYQTYFNSGNCQTINCSVESNDDPYLYDGCPLRLSQSLLLHLTVASRHNLSSEALSDILFLSSLHCKRPNPCKTSAKELRNYFSLSNLPFEKHYFCKGCYALLETVKDGETKHIISCKECGQKEKEKTSTGYFIYLPIEEQLQKLSKSPSFFNHLKYRFTRQKKDPTGIEDVYDGKLYQKFYKSGFLSDPNNISFQFNTDGVALFKSSSFQLWPIFLKINELPPKLRSSRKYKILAGLWFHTEKPLMATYLSPLKQELERLSMQGAHIKTGGKEVIMKCLLLNGLLDLPAKCIVQETVQFNGGWGCGTCEDQGKNVTTDKGGNVRVFPLENINLCPRERNKTRMLAHSLLALENKEPYYGVKGFCILGKLTYFDPVWGLPVDYMHGSLLGVCRMLLALWLDSEHCKDVWYCGTYINSLDEVFLRIKPISEITRTPRSIVIHRKYWKASELRNWLLFYSAPLMKLYLSDNYFHHFLYFIKGIYILLKDSISVQDLTEADRCLKLFTFFMDGLYGERYCTANVHNLIHMAKGAEIHGNAWTNSCFDYEDWNGDFRHLFHGTQNVDEQVINAIVAVQKLPELAECLEDESIEKEFYLKLIKEKQGPVYGEKIGTDTYIIGNCSIVDVKDEHKPAVYASLPPPGTHLIFFRLHKSSTLYQCTEYRRVTARNNYTVSYINNKENKIGVINYFIKYVPHCIDSGFQCSSKACNAKFYCVVTPLTLVENGKISSQALGDSVAVTLDHIAVMYRNRRNTVNVIPVDNIVEKLIVVETEEIIYASRPPNKYEKD